MDYAESRQQARALNRSRLFASPAVLAEAEQLLRRITEQYFSNSLTIEEMCEIAPSEGGDPLNPFAEACCVESASISATLSVAFPPDSLRGQPARRGRR